LKIENISFFQKTANRKCLNKKTGNFLQIVPFFKLCSEEKTNFFLDFSFIFLTKFFFYKIIFFCETLKSQSWTFLKCPKSISTTFNNVPKWGVPFFRRSLKNHVFSHVYVLTLILCQNILSKVSHKPNFVTLPFFIFYKIRLK